MATNDGVATLKPWETVDFPHFVGVRHRSGAWSTVILKPSGQEIDVASLGGRRVVLHGNGIEFLPPLPPGDGQTLTLPGTPPEDA
ncbi:hypothetical protein D7Y15_23220 [Corallococcus sp. AB030]|uniref:hypothetical protein n=1 Tax=Corallococcus sp. AB030 TaxID=2316716 RepID=UPI000EE0CABF|nr:hypothetical protein [Corallococcus sp. AB030]RKI09812.1 hypothetical protein D7Y15_23220 [Corallococcus sp. AB030]